MEIKANMGLRQKKPQNTIDCPEVTKASMSQNFLTKVRGAGSCQYCDVGYVTSKFITELTP